MCYIRSKKVDEPRLAKKVSIGIGGHINPSDSVNVCHGDLFGVYSNAVAREVAEEVIINSEYRTKIVGLINDDSNNVGQVHFGIVHFWKLKRPDVRKKEQTICRLQFMSLQELQSINYKMESWSLLCLDSINEFAKIANR